MPVVYDEEGLKAEIIDGDAVAIYLEGQLQFECTMSEFHSIAFAVLHSPVVGDGE